MHNQHENSQPLIACNLGAIDPAQRDEHVARAERVFAAVLETKELADGYGFRLPLETAMLREVTEWVANERLCCPFFTFTLVVGDQLWLELSGGGEVKGFIKLNMVDSLNEADALPDKEA